MSSYEDLSEVRAIFIKCCPSLNKPQDVEIWNAVRKNRTKALLKVHGIDGLSEMFVKAEQSDFLSGRSGKWKRCCYDWLIKPANWQKLVEGNYDNRTPSDNIGKSSYDIKQANYDAACKPIKYIKKQDRVEKQ